jgi:hypothetical protein
MSFGVVLLGEAIRVWVVRKEIQALVVVPGPLHYLRKLLTNCQTPKVRREENLWQIGSAT